VTEDDAYTTFQPLAADPETSTVARPSVVERRPSNRCVKRTADDGPS